MNNEQLTEKEKIRIANATIDGYFSKSHLNTDEQRNFDLILSLFEDILTERVALAKQEGRKEGKKQVIGWLKFIMGNMFLTWLSQQLEDEKLSKSGGEKAV